MNQCYSVCIKMFTRGPFSKCPGAFDMILIMFVEVLPFFSEHFLYDIYSNNYPYVCLKAERLLNGEGVLSQLLFLMSRMNVEPQMKILSCLQNVFTK